MWLAAPWEGDSFFKKEHLELDEVIVLLRKIKIDKRAADSASRKREHEFFFIPNGGKILVTSYALLGRDRLEGFMMDFNSLVRNVNGAQGMMRIQVLPVVLVVRKGMVKGGRELI